MGRLSKLLCCFPSSRIEPSDDYERTLNQGARETTEARLRAYGQKQSVRWSLFQASSRKQSAQTEVKSPKKKRSSQKPRFIARNPQNSQTNQTESAASETSGASGPGVTSVSNGQSQQASNRQWNNVPEVELREDDKVSKKSSKESVKSKRVTHGAPSKHKTSSFAPANCQTRSETRTTQEILKELRKDGLIGGGVSSPEFSDKEEESDHEFDSAFEPEHKGGLKFNVMMGQAKIRRPPPRLAKIDLTQRTSATKEKIDSKLAKAAARRQEKTEKFKERENARKTHAKSKKQAVDTDKQNKAVKRALERKKKREEAEIQRRRTLWEKRHRMKKAKRCNQKRRESKEARRPGETDAQFLDRFFMDGDSDSSTFSDAEAKARGSAKADDDFID